MRDHARAQISAPGDERARSCGSGPMNCSLAVGCKVMKPQGLAAQSLQRKRKSVPPGYCHRRRKNSRYIVREVGPGSSAGVERQHVVRDLHAGIAGCTTLWRHSVSKIRREMLRRHLYLVTSQPCAHPSGGVNVCPGCATGKFFGSDLRGEAGTRLCKLHQAS
jgi:hypothetical protein